MKKILYKIFVLCAFVVTLTGCELYMDDRDIQLGNPVADGDGYSAPATYMDSITTVTYQFNENTVYINEPYRPHIFSANVDTASKTIEIRFAKSIPADMMPQRGNCLASSLYDIFNATVCHKVDVVEEADGLYVVKGHAVPTKEVFKHLKAQSEFYVEEEPDQNRSGMLNSKGRPTSGARLRAVDHNYTGNSRFSETLKPIDLLRRQFCLGEDEGLDESLNEIVGKYFETVKAFKNKDFSKIAKEEDKFNSYIKFSGELKGFLGVDIALRLHVSYNFDTDNDIYDLHARLVQECLAGLIVKSLEGVCTIPILGVGPMDVFYPQIAKSFGLIVEGSEEVNKYLFPILELSAAVATPVGTFKFYVTPSIIAQFFAKIQFDQAIGVYVNNTEEIAEFGFYKSDEREFLYGGETKSKPKKDDKISNIDFSSDFSIFADENDEDDNGEPKQGIHITGLSEPFNFQSFNFNAGVTLIFGIELGVSYCEAVDIYGAIDLSSEWGLSYRDKEIYKNKLNIIDDRKTLELTTDQESYLSFGIYMKPKFGGRIGKFNLFTLAPSTPFTLYENKQSLAPEFSTTVLLNEKLSGEKEAVFTAELKTKYNFGPLSYFFSPKESPKLALYSCDDKDWTKSESLNFIKVVSASNEGKYDNNDTYYYTFNIPYDDKEIHNLNKRTYIVIPYYENLLDVHHHARGTAFKMQNLYGKITSAQQISITGGESSDGKLNTYGFVFEVDANTIPPYKWEAIIQIVNSETGEWVASKTFNLGYLKGNVLHRYLMYYQAETLRNYDIYINLNYAIENYEEYDDTESITADSRTLSMQALPIGENMIYIDYKDLFTGKINGYEVLE